MPDWVGWTTFATGMIAAVVSAVIQLSRRHTERRGEEKEQDEHGRAGTIKEWKDLARAQAVAHKTDMENAQLQLKAHRQEIMDLREAERQCQINSARFQAENEWLRNENKELREENARLRSEQRDG